MMTKEKKRIYNKAYYQTNAEKAKAYSKTYYLANTPKIKAYSKAYSKVQRQVNPEKIKVYNKAYRLANREKARAYMKEYYATYIVKIKTERAAYYQANKKRMSAKYREYYTVNRKKINASRRANPEKGQINNGKRRALEFGVGHEPYSSNYIFRRDGYVCQICLRKINKRLKWPNPLCASIDHIVPLSKGGNDNPANVQATHLRCNVGKHATNKGQLRLFG